MSSMSKPVWDVPPETDDGTLYRYECYQPCAVHLLYVAFRFCHGFSIFHVQWLSPAWYQQNGSGFTVQIERQFWNRWRPMLKSMQVEHSDLLQQARIWHLRKWFHMIFCQPSFAESILQANRMLGSRHWQGSTSERFRHRYDPAPGKMKTWTKHQNSNLSCG